MSDAGCCITGEVLSRAHGGDVVMAMVERMRASIEALNEAVRKLLTRLRMRAAGKQGAEEADSDEAGEAGESGFVPTRLEQVRALTEFHLRRCHYQQCEPDYDAVRESNPMSQQDARSHWFEYHPPVEVVPGLEPEHEGKKYKIASDTWNRLDAAMNEIKRRRLAGELFRSTVIGKTPEQYKNRTRQIPDDLW